MLNLSIMRHWENWVVLILMASIACVAVNLTARLILTEKES